MVDLTCPECGKFFPGEYLLKWHVESVHLNPIQKEENNVRSALPIKFLTPEQEARFPEYVDK